MDQQKIGRFIAELRHEQGWTQEQLAEKLCVSNKTISRWETGKYLPDISMLKELSELLQISINELLSGERITEVAAFSQKADENLLQALSAESAFALQDRIAYFKKKWLKEHRQLILTCIALFSIAFAAAVYIKTVIGISIISVLLLLCYVYLRNKMMIYVEHRAFKENE